MINIFNELFTNLTSALTTYSSAIKTSSVYTNSPSSYPFVSIEEIDNSVYEQGQDDTTNENFAEVDYEINIYTKDPLKKSTNDAIQNVVDNYFKSNGFTRRSRNILQNDNETIYRTIVRYSAVVSNAKDIYRR